MVAALVGVAGVIGIWNVNKIADLSDLILTEEVPIAVVSKDLTAAILEQQDAAGMNVPSAKDEKNPNQVHPQIVEDFFEGDSHQDVF